MSTPKNSPNNPPPPRRTLTTLRALLLAGVALSLVSPWVNAAVVTHNLSVSVGAGQITDNGFPFNDVWDSGQLHFPQQMLNGGDTLVLNITLEDNCIKMTDNLFNDDESIYFFIGGSGGVGGGLVHALDYKWEFTDVEGNLLVNPIMGQGVLSGVSGNGLITPGNDSRNINLTNSSFCFCDVHLTITVPGTIGAPWNPSFVRIKTDADTISLKAVPEPCTLLTFGIGSLGLIASRYRRKRLT